MKLFTVFVTKFSRFFLDSILHFDKPPSHPTGHCYLFGKQYKLDFSGLSGRSTSNARDEEGNSGMQGSDSKGSATSEASM